MRLRTTRLGVTSAGRSAVSLDRQIAALFAQGEQGAWYDIDPAYCFQDTAGTTPAAIGDPVGLVLDRSKGLVLGPDLVVNGDFSEGGTGWTVVGTVTITGGKATIFSTGPAATLAQQSILVPRKSYLVDFSVVVRSGQGKLEGPGGSIAFSFSASGNYSVLLTGVNHLIFNRVSACDFDIDNISVRELPGNHAYQTTATSRPILRQNAVTGAYYLEFDGSDDFLVTNSIDFTSTDKMTVWAGVTSKSATAAGAILELGLADSAQGFMVWINESNAQFRLTTVSQINVSKSAAYPVDVAVVSRVAYDTSRTNNFEIQPAINGVTTGFTNNSGAGTGNFQNGSLYIGKRSNNSLRFNGHLYGLIVRGAASNDSQIKIVERYLAQKTGVTLA